MFVVHIIFLLGGAMLSHLLRRESNLVGCSGRVGTLRNPWGVLR